MSELNFPDFIEDSFDVCMNCKRVPMKKLIENPSALTSADAERYRGQWGCRGCKAFGRKEGIYKFDAILTSHAKAEHVRMKKNVGKKETYTKRYGKAISEMRKDGISIRKIADTLGISTRSVQNVMKNLK